MSRAEERLAFCAAWRNDYGRKQAKLNEMMEEPWPRSEEFGRAFKHLSDELDVMPTRIYTWTGSDGAKYKFRYDEY